MIEHLWREEYGGVGNFGNQGKFGFVFQPCMPYNRGEKGLEL